MCPTKKERALKLSFTASFMDKKLGFKVNLGPKIVHFECIRESLNPKAFSCYNSDIN